MKFENVGYYLAYFLSIIFIGYIILTIDSILLDLVPKSFEPENTYLNWCLIIFIFYLLPSVCLTIIFLKFLSNEHQLFIPKLFSLDAQYIKLSLNKEIFKRVIEVSTIIATFFLLTSKSYPVKSFNNPFDSILFAIYPANFGFKLWEYTLPTAKNKQYFPHRKFK